VWQAPELVLRSAKPSSMWPVAPFPPSADSASIEATHAGVPAAVVVELLVGEAVVVTVVVAADEVVVAEALAVLPALASLLVLADDPHPVRASATSTAVIVGRVYIASFSAMLSSNPSPNAEMPTLDAPTDPDRTDAEDRAESLLASYAATITRWDPYLAPQLIVACAIMLDLALPKKVTIGPSWLLPSFEGLLLIGLSALTPRPSMRDSPLRRQFALGLIALVSAVNSVSLVLLCHYLLHGRSENGRDLIGAGAVLWVTNVLLFALWFWQLDRGGPLARRSTPEPPDFLFPQMTEPKLADGWEPNLIDYMYVSFTNATAFSPTDAMPLSRTAKVLMAAQALTALVTVGLVVARAVNILN
jgi:hypothetical protein